jgi:uncharacterized protein with PIN domain
MWWRQSYYVGEQCLLCGVEVVLSREEVEEAVPGVVAGGGRALAGGGRHGCSVCTTLKLLQAEIEGGAASGARRHRCIECGSRLKSTHKKKKDDEDDTWGPYVRGQQPKSICLGIK